MPAPLESSATTQDTILRAVRDRLISQIPDVTEKNCEITDEETPPAGMNEFYWITIWPLGGQFDQEAFDGGGIHAVIENAGMAITVYRRNPIDQAGRAEKLLLLPETGLLDLKRLILKTLLSQERIEFEQHFVLAGQMRPRTSDHPRNMPHKTSKVGDIYLEFDTPILWDLS